MDLETSSIKTELKKYLQPGGGGEEYKLLREKMVKDFNEEAVAEAEKKAKAEIKERSGN